MKLAQSVKKMWKTRDELSPRNFRVGILPLILILPLTVIIGDLRFFDQELVIFGIDSNNLMMMIFGVGFLPVLFIDERHVPALLRVSVVLQIALLTAQFFVGWGTQRFIVFLAFHAVNGVGTACGFYLFAFALNNVERFFTMVVLQVYYAFTYLLAYLWPGTASFVTAVSVMVMLVLVAAAFLVKGPVRTVERPGSEPGARESGVAAIIMLNMIFYVITLMSMYIGYKEHTASVTLYGVGGMASALIIFVVMLVFNYSALHLWSLCLICSVLGIGALHYAPELAVNAGSLVYGVGAGLGFMIVFYLQGGALKRSGSFKLFQLCCLFTCAGYVVVSGAFYALYDSLAAPGLYLAFPAVLVLALICFLFSPALQNRLFKTDWTDGYHMADMPLYTKTREQVERIDKERLLGLTPRETEIFTMLLTDASPKQIAGILKISMGTVNFHTSNLYRKLEIQSRTELFANYAYMLPR